MRNNRNNRFASLWRAGRVSAALLAAPATVFTVQGCTDLEETPTSAITPNNFYKNADEVLGGVASVYAQLRSTMWGYYNLSQVSSDETIVPTRGSDWFDNGRWLDLYRHTWTPTSGAGLEDISGVWNDLFAGVARANVLLSALETTDVPNKAQVVAEMKALRAFYYYLLMDFFGGVPIVTTTEVKPRAQASRAEVFAFVEKELTEARAALPDAWPSNQFGRMTKFGADAILANMYLNGVHWYGDHLGSHPWRGEVGGSGGGGGSRAQLGPLQPAGRLEGELLGDQRKLAREHLHHPSHRQPDRAGHVDPDAWPALQLVQPVAVERLRDDRDDVQRVRRRGQPQVGVPRRSAGRPEDGRAHPGPRG